MGLVPFIHLLVTAVQDYITFLATFFSLSVKSHDDVSSLYVYMYLCFIHMCVYTHVCVYMFALIRSAV